MTPDAPVLTLRLVYWGPEGAGARENLRALHAGLAPGAPGVLRRTGAVRPGDARADFLGLDLGELSGWLVRLHVHAAPGAPFHEATRRRLLDGADGVVFVADPQLRRVTENLASLRELFESLTALGHDPRTFPLVRQQAKQDLPAVLRGDDAAWDAWLDLWSIPVVEAEAVAGRGVFETLRVVVGLALARRERASATVDGTGGMDGG